MHLPVVEEMVVLERIEFIARLGGCHESQAKDKEIALIWISELAGEIKTCANGASGEIDRERSSA